MTVDEAKAINQNLVIQKNGKEYHFCNTSCKENFATQKWYQTKTFSVIFPPVLGIVLTLGSILSIITDSMMLFMGLFFVVFALAKMMDLHGFAEAFSKYDIIAFNLPWLGELVEEDVLQPLSKFLFSERINLQDFHQAGIEGSTYNHDIFGLPIETIPDLLFYRKDILNKYGLNPPNTTDDLLNTALTIQNQKCELPPISWPAQKGTPLGTSFILALANFGQPIINLKHIHSNNFDTSRLDKNIKPLINTNTAIKAGNYL